MNETECYKHAKELLEEAIYIFDENDVTSLVTQALVLLYLAVGETPEIIRIDCTENRDGHLERKESDCPCPPGGWRSECPIHKL